jgi:hypothetical protein
MHGFITRVNIDPARADEARELLQGFTIPTAKSQSGFVRGVWLRSDDGSNGCGVVVFDTQEHAQAAADLARQGPPPGSPVTMRSIEVFEVVGEA